MYYLVYAFFYIMSLLPWRVMYIISDFIYLIVYYVVGYRKDIVMNNLLIAFPEKTFEQRKKIAKEFYKIFTDSFIEIFKLMFITKEELNKRITANYEVINNLYESGKNVQLLSGHFFNWEFANLVYAINLKYTFMGVYAPLSNKTLDKIFYKYRKKFGTILIPSNDFKNTFQKNNKLQYCIALVGDQNPRNIEKAYWTKFFGRMTPVVMGPERSAKFENTAVVVANFYRVKRGYYRSECKLLTIEPSSMQHGEITKQYLLFIEESVKKNPAGYLWSHRRWRHEFDKEKYASQVI